ncbi:hypothetical protein PAPHI01_0832 [Pancytospora philotis]|nr:hypothetical protein PAPHI01_0832 [Pancytospora philotis]
MRCEICGTPYRQKESSLVCANGHTIQNTVEVIDDTGGIFHSRKKRIRVAKEPLFDPCPADLSVAQFTIFKALFDEAMAFFGIASDRVYRCFTNFFTLERRDGDEQDTRIIGDHVLSSQTLLALVYLSKRAEAEAGGGLYTFEEFAAAAARFKLNFRLRDIVRARKLRFRNWAEMLMPDCQLRIVALANHTQQIADFDCFSFNRSEQAEVHPTGVLLLGVERAKESIRSLFCYEPALMLRYFEHVCTALQVAATDDMRFYFKKYIYVLDRRRLVVPELAFGLFVAAYFIERQEFANTPLESGLLLFLRVSKARLVELANEHASFLYNHTSPELLIKAREVANAERFVSLRRAIWVIDTFKKHKKG